MLQYDGDLKIPTDYLVQPPVIKNTLTERLCQAGIHEYALSETQKFGHAPISGTATVPVRWTRIWRSTRRSPPM